ncbi:OmpL47-type beta-barrel domain-containing protein [Paenibacillus turpanensis]|uniref:OmpL47-type beta-barrel domain-containing protein n=1 Tax=Paenibacillus turpanensis TaxID=2689078 RepID=UPI00140CD751|nr:Ig-like domain-containing protein [Paenibacillus turpanensis]
MTAKLCQRLIILTAVMLVCTLAGWNRQAHAAVMMEALPESANMPETLESPYASLYFLGNDILVTGGLKNMYGFASHSYVFHPSTQTWSGGAAALQLGYHRQSMLNDGRVFVTGGQYYDPAPASGISNTYNNRSRIYNPATNSWTDAANIPKAAMFDNSQSTLKDGRVMIVGGSTEMGRYGEIYNNAYIYTPSTDSWQEVAPLPNGVYGAAQSTLNDGRVLVTGGEGGPFNEAYIYDPSKNTWTKTADFRFSELLVRHTQVTLPNGKVLLMSPTHFFLYDPETDTWKKDSAIPVNLKERPSLVPVGDKVYVFGGYENLNYKWSNKVYKLTIDFDDPTAPVIHGANQGWSTSDAAITFTPGTDVGSGVKHVEYMLSGATTKGWTTYQPGETISITNSGQTSVSARTVDNSGNISPLATGTVSIDRTPPTAPVISRSAESWAAKHVTFTISASDPGASGLNYTEFSLSGATTLGWTRYTGTTTISAEGQTTIRARAVDKAGNVSSESTAVISIDKTLPTVPSLTSSTTSWSKENVSVTVAPGTDSGGSGVNRTEYRLIGASTLNWTTYSGPITVSAEGYTTVYARTIDNAGNISTASSIAVMIDKTQPAVPSVIPEVTTWTSAPNVNVTLDTGPDSGSGMNRLEYSLSGATTKGWTVYSVPFPVSAEGQTTVNARVIDNAGNVSAVSSGTVKIDRTAPAAPGMSPSGGEWTSSNITVTLSPGGDAASGASRVEYSMSGATTEDWKTYTGPISITAEGNTTLSARTVDHAGNVSASADANYLIDKTLPSMPTIGAGTTDWTSASSVPFTITPGNDSGSGINRTEYSLSGASTAGWTARLTGEVTVEGVTTISARTIDHAGNSSLVRTAVISIDRTAPAQPMITPETTGTTSAAAVSVSIDGGSDGGSGFKQIEYSLSGASTLGWTPYSAPISITSEGLTTVNARAVDLVGNVSSVSMAVVQIDRTAPAVPVIVTPVQGGTTGNNKPAIQGTAEAGSSVTLRLDGNLLSPLAAGGGQWSYTPSSALADGVHTVTAFAKDTAGNESPVTASVSFTVDTTAPAAPAIHSPANGAVLNKAKPVLTGQAEALSVVKLYIDASLMGTAAADGSGAWSFVLTTPLADGAHTLKAEAEDAAGNVGPLSSEVTWKQDTVAPGAPLVLTPQSGSFTYETRPVISGTAEAGAAVSIRLDGNDLAVVTADGSGNWLYTPAAALADGVYNIEADAKDAAGNVSPASGAVRFTVDTAAPAAPTITSPAKAAQLNLDQPTIHGLAEAGAAVRITLDGAEAAGTVMADDSGSWSFTPSSALTDGLHTVKAAAVDAAGNVGPASEGVAFTVDTTAPAAPVVVSPAKDTATAMAELSISGTSEASVTVSVYLDGTLANKVQANGSGAWSFTPTGVLNVGPHTVQVQAVDAAGNASELTDEHSFRIVSDNAGLGMLKLSGIELNETVTSSTYSYTAKVPYSLSSTVITAAALDPNASVRILQDGQGVTGPVGLLVGKQTFTVEVTAQDGKTVGRYTVMVERSPSSVVSLSELTVSPAALLPAFDEGITEYTATVANSVYRATISARATSAEARIEINGTPFAGPEGALPVDLSVGSNPITILVTAQDGVSTQKYEVDLNRAPSSNVLLNGLDLSAGAVEPAFDSGIVRYKTKVNYGTASTTVTASVYDPNATLAVNGVPLLNGQPSQPIALEVGVNPISVTVTAQDRVTTQSYVVEVTRKPIPDVTLTGLELTDGRLAPAFTSGVTSYTAWVSYETEQTTVTAAVYDPAEVRLSINGKAAVSDQAVEPIPLQVGANTINLTVTALDGTAEKTYTVVVNRMDDSDDDSSDSPIEVPLPEEAAQPEPVRPEAPKPEPAKQPKGELGFRGCEQDSGTQDSAASSGAFADMQGHWAEDVVVEAKECGIVSGYVDGTFQPDEAITRVQFIVMLMNAAKSGADNGSPASAAPTFTDAESIPDWAMDKVAAAKALGIVGGYEDGTLRPNDYVTRAEMITLAAKAAGLEPAAAETEDETFSDIGVIPQWAAGYAEAARQQGFVQGREQGDFAPLDRTTRAEAAALLLRMIQSP